MSLKKISEDFVKKKTKVNFLIFEKIYTQTVVFFCKKLQNVWKKLKLQIDELNQLTITKTTWTEKLQQSINEYFFTETKLNESRESLK